MTDEPKYLIVAAGWSDYDRFIRRKRLDPASCRQMPSTVEAFETRWLAPAPDDVLVCWTPEFLDQSPIGRRTS